MYASENMNFSTSVAGLGMLFKESVYMGNLTKQTILTLGNSTISFDPYGFRKEYMELVANISN